MPVAALGLAVYVAIGTLTAGAALRRDVVLLSVAWALAVAGFAFSMYLTYVELRVLHAICVYCVASATTVSVLFSVLSCELALAMRSEAQAGPKGYMADTQDRVRA